MGAPVDVGTGTTIVFGTSGFSAQVLDVTPPAPVRETFDTSHMGTAAPGAGTMGNRTFIASKLVDASELSFELHFDPDDVPPIHGPFEQVTVTFPVPSGLINGATWVFQGAVVGYEPSVPLDGKMTATLRVKVSGGIVVTAAS